jgi:hypothetical protein
MTSSGTPDLHPLGGGGLHPYLVEQLEAPAYPKLRQEAVDAVTTMLKCSSPPGSAEATAGGVAVVGEVAMVGGGEEAVNGGTLDRAGASPPGRARISRQGKGKAHGAAKPSPARSPSWAESPRGPSICHGGGVELSPCHVAAGETRGER